MLFLDILVATLLLKIILIKYLWTILYLITILIIVLYGHTYNSTMAKPGLVLRESNNRGERHLFLFFNFILLILIIVLKFSFWDWNQTSFKKNIWKEKTRGDLVDLTTRLTRQEYPIKNLVESRWFFFFTKTMLF